MKKALVLAIVCAVGLGVAAVAAPLYGSWDTSVCFTVQTAGAVYISSMSSTIGLGYTVGGWDFAMYMVLDEGGLTDLYFLTDGSLGAFSFYSYLGFDPVGIAFTQWDNAGAISLAGISAYGLFSLENINGFIGSGWTAGGYGSAGDVYVHGEVQFNLAPTIALIDAYGWDGFLAKNTAKSGAWISILQTDCCVCFTGFDLYVYFPFTCLDLKMTLAFDCVMGFEEVCFIMQDIDLGTWFMISELGICFTVQTKSVYVDFDLVVGDTVCFTPYFSLVPGTDAGWEVVGISFDAFTIEYSWNGVTFWAGHIFNVEGYCWDGLDLSDDCQASVEGIDEFFGVVAEGDSCCGGLWSASMFLYFNSASNGGSPGIFDWVSALGELEFGIASNLSITANVDFGYDGLSDFCVGFEFTW